MNFLKLAFSFYRDNKLEVWITLLVFSNIFQQFVPAQLYFVGLFLFAYQYRKYKPVSHPQRGLFIAFILVLWFSSVVGFVLDFRLVAITIVLVVSAPSISYEWYCYKLNLLKCFYWGFAGVTLLNFYAKLIDYNYIAQFQDIYSMGRQFEFSGFGRFAMWTSCAAAISTMVFTSYAFRNRTPSKLYNIISFAMILVSLYIVMISASRAAFVLAIACSLLIVKMQTNNDGKLLRNLIILGVTASLFAPILEDNAEAMLRKRNGFEITTKNTSREELWGSRMEEFRSSPIWGIGFAAHGVGANKRIGRFESGGSYISVLAQAGLIGILLVFFIWLAASSLPSNIPKDPDVILTYCAFVFMTFHCTIEGYMFQAGWYLCFIVWLIVGVMIETKYFKNEIEEENLE
jgi:O-antigen ligase